MCACVRACVIMYYIILYYIILYSLFYNIPIIGLLCVSHAQW